LDGLPNWIPGLVPQIVAIPASSASPTLLSTLVVNVTNSGPNERATTVALSVPSGAIPGATRLEVQSVSTVESLLVEAPLPVGGGRLLSAFSVRAIGANGLAIETVFAEPVAITVTIPAAAVPPGATASDFTLVFWSGTQWVAVESESTLSPDGSVRIRVAATHFTLYAVRYLQPLAGAPVGFLGPALFGSTQTAAVVFPAGGTIDELLDATRRAGAVAVWVQDGRGIYRLLRVGASVSAIAQFMSYFTDGFTAPTAMRLVKEAVRNEASPDEGSIGATRH
jgi:hypothetical protein